MTAVQVHLDGPDGPVVVGVASIDRLHGATTTRVTYDDTYLSGPGWDISPDLPVIHREAVTDGLPGALDDSAPDTWGRNLIRRRLAAEARDAGVVAPEPTEVDYLLGVSDLTRQGALRYTRPGGTEFLGPSTEVPRLVQLSALLDAARRVDADGGRDTDDDAVAALLAAGSGSLGGARPKASVVDGDRLLIAKFGQSTDEWDVMRWEAVALDLAEACRIPVPPHALHVVGADPVLLSQRFDRHGATRIPFLSARSLVGRDAGDYLDIVEGIATHGSEVRDDLVDLWRRIAFSIAINNVDDHMRNHAFLRSRGGWRLSPVFDVNPHPDPTMTRATSVSGATTPQECVDALLRVAHEFGLDRAIAERHWSEIVAGVARWRAVAAARGIPEPSIERFVPALTRW